MKIEDGMLMFKVTLKEGEGIGKFLSLIPHYEKQYTSEDNTWHIHNKHKSDFLKSIKKKDQLDLFD
jgi:hypothetical protein